MFSGPPQFGCCPEKWSAMNRISHPHWMKICADPDGQINLHAKQKYEILSATKSYIKQDWVLNNPQGFYAIKHQSQIKI